MSKENVLKAITGLVASLQKSLHKVRQKTTENTEDIELLGDNVTELNDDQTALLKRIVEQGKISVESDCQLSDKIEANRVQAFQRTEALALQIAKVKEENDQREERQTLRDQNNVQSLVNLRDSTHTAFQQVKTDVQNLIKTDQGLSRRLYEVESRLSNPAPAPQMPSDHVWVNKKLSGVYDSVADLEGRLQALEMESETARELRKSLRLFLRQS
jgi:hypothetical protein